jgi:hypothetical protein
VAQRKRIELRRKCPVRESGFGIYDRWTTDEHEDKYHRQGELTMEGLSMVWLIMSIYHPASVKAKGYEIA